MKLFCILGLHFRVTEQVRALKYAAAFAARKRVCRCCGDVKWEVFP
jgi:hypothetical protein